MTGVGSDNIENGAIALPAFLGNNCVVDAALDLACAGDGAHVVQCGAGTATTNIGQKLVFGTEGISSTTIASTDGDASFAIAYNAGVGCTTAWATGFAIAPFVQIVCPQAGVTTTGDNAVAVHVTAVGTTQVQGWVECAESFDETFHWMAVGAL